MKKNIVRDSGDVVIYKSKAGQVQLKADSSRETIWATQDQIAELFGRDISVVSRHLRNIFREKELDKKTTVAKNATVQMEGGRETTRVIKYYNLDVILSVGYRVNSKQATEFRIWATSVLKEHLIGRFVSKRTGTEVAGGFGDLRDAIAFIESKTRGRAKATMVIKLKKELIP